MTEYAVSERINDDSSLSGWAFRQLINGKLVPGTAEIPVIDPATEEVIAQAPVADSDQLDQAVRAAKVAFQSWKNRPLDERRAIIREIADRIESRRGEIARIITLEVGKPIAAARADVDLALHWAREVVEVALLPEILQDDDQAYVEVRRRPIGVVAAIIPWNFPFFQMVYKIVPALLTGNTVVVKPSPTTPLNAMILAEILKDVVPSGVVNIIGDAGDIGPLLTTHPNVGKVSFTGSTAAGRKVMASSAPTLKRLTLELGGNDAAVILDDADIVKTARQVFAWAFMNSGQVCINIKRIYVPDSLYDPFCDEFARLARSAVVGPGLNETSEFGPIQNERQYKSVLHYLELAHRDGTVIAGGAPLTGQGYFVPPTVVRDIDESSVLVSEETFGPIRSVMRYSSIDEVVQRVNNTQYGLGNSVWGKDLERAAAVAARLESGTVWVNAHFALAPNVPFAGSKQSGLGAEFGMEGVHEFTDCHVIHISRAQL